MDQGTDQHAWRHHIVRTDVKDAEITLAIDAADIVVVPHNMPFNPNVQSGTQGDMRVGIGPDLAKLDTGRSELIAVLLFLGRGNRRSDLAQACSELVRAPSVRER